MLDITTLAAWGEFIGGIAVVVTLAYLAFQMRQNTETVRANSVRELTESILSATAALIESENADLYLRGARSYSSLTSEEKLRFGMLLGLFLLFLQLLVNRLVNQPLVAIDAGLAFLLRVLVLHFCPVGLLFQHHPRAGMTVAAFPRIGLLIQLPDPLRHLQAVGFKFLFRVQLPGEVIKNFLRPADLVHHYLHPVAVGHVAVGATRAYAGRILVVRGLDVLLENGAAHLVAGNAKIVGVAVLKETGEGARKNDSGDSADDEYHDELLYCSALPRRVIVKIPLDCGAGERPILNIPRSDYCGAYEVCP